MAHEAAGDRGSTTTTAAATRSDRQQQSKVGPDETGTTKRVVGKTTPQRPDETGTHQKGK